MSSRLSFVKKHLIIQSTHKPEKDSGIFILAIQKYDLPSQLKSNDHISGSAILAKSMKAAVQKAKLAPQSLEVIVMGSSLLANGQMPALTDNFSIQFGTSLGSYIMNSSSGLRPLIQSIKQIQYNKKGIVGLGSLQKPKKQVYYGQKKQLQLTEVKKQDNFDSMFQSKSKEQRNKNKPWKLSQKQKIEFIKNVSKDQSTLYDRNVDFNFQEPETQIMDNNGTITRGGACSMILMSGERLSRTQNVYPLAKIIAYSQSPINTSDVFITLFSSLTICLQRAKLTIEDIDYFQFRQQYPMIPYVISRMFKIDKKKINLHHQIMTIGGPSKVNGGAVVQNLIHLMKQRGGKYGLASICNQNGMSTSIIISNIKS